MNKYLKAFIITVAIMCVVLFTVALSVYVPYLFLGILAFAIGYYAVLFIIE